MHKKDYLKPDESDLVAGNVMPIYDNYYEEEDFVGNAELIERSPGWRPEMPYIRAEIGGTDLQDPHTINWCIQRWIVRFVDGPRKGFQTARFIAYFYSIDSYLPFNKEI